MSNVFLGQLDTLIDEAEIDGKHVKYLIMTKEQARKLWAVLQPQVRFMSMTENVHLPTYGGASIIRVVEDDEVILDLRNESLDTTIK